MQTGFSKEHRPPKTYPAKERALQWFYWQENVPMVFDEIVGICCYFEMCVDRDAERNVFYILPGNDQYIARFKILKKELQGYSTGKTHRSFYWLSRVNK